MVKLYFDANVIALGRVGSMACKELLKGKEVAIINAEKSIIPGNPQEVIGSVS